MNHIYLTDMQNTKLPNKNGKELYKENNQYVN